MKILRIETRSGQIRVVQLAPYPDLPTWINVMRRDGWYIGTEWALPFDSIALIDVVEVENPGNSEKETPENSEASVHRLSNAIRGGLLPRVE